MSFSISKEQLALIVQKTQKRQFAEEVESIITNSKPNQWITSAVNSCSKAGIIGDEEDVEQRQTAFGSNQKPKKEASGLCELLCQALEDFTLRILIVAAIFSIVIQVGTAKPQKRSLAWIQGFAILVAVFISAGVSAINDYRKQRQFLKLYQISDARKKVTVKRNGKVAEIHQDKVLVGDIVSLAEGMEIPADGYLLEGSEVTTDQSAMTGETEPMRKAVVDDCIQKIKEIVEAGEKNKASCHDVPSPIIFSGTKVLTGEGKMLVIVVGDLSVLGKIRALLQQDQAVSTPLQNKLEKIAEDIGKFGLYSAIVILVILLIRFGIEKIISQHWDSSVDFPEILHFFILAITVIVVAIPEGLPLAVTLSLAFSVQKMLNDNNLVRKMEACETMGGANNICSDKTGTLTKNQMTLTTYWNGSLREFQSSSKSIRIQDYFGNQQFRELYKLAACVNSSALLRPESKGSSTELAILKLIQKMGFNYETERQQNHPIMKFPFSSKRKIMSVLIPHNNKQLMLTKGASEIVLKGCTHWHCSKSGEVLPIDSKMEEVMQGAIRTMAEKSLRTLCLAYKYKSEENLTEVDGKGVYSIEKNNFVLLAIIGVQDIHRAEVPEAIINCKKAGIKVRMVTGDNIITARAIAIDVGIISANDPTAIVMNGVDFIEKIGGVVCKKCRTAKCDCPINVKQVEQKKDRAHKMNQDASKIQLRIDTVQNAEQFDKLADNLYVLARSRPQDKYALVTGLKERGNVVAVTGDGTNDAPALKKADVGFAMGIAGTQVAREAADIILQDDNFSSIVKAVLWGRNIYDSIRKFIQFQLTVNIVAVSITLIGAGLIKQSILKPIQMLWINLIMDTLASLALATQPPTQKLLLRKPHSRFDYIISKTMMKHILGQAIYQLIVMIILTFLADQVIPEYADSYDSRPGFMANYKYTPDMTMRSGRFIHITGEGDYQPIFEATYVNSRHFTFIFNTFVMMQIFNFLNSRKIHDQFNIFENISSNWLFIVIVIVIAALQVLLISVGGVAFGVYPYGLHITQWLICIVIGSGSLAVSVLLKLLPIVKMIPDQGEDQQVDMVRHSSKIIKIKRRPTLTNKSLSFNHIE